MMILLFKCALLQFSLRFSIAAIRETELTRIQKEILKDYEKRSIPIRDGKPLFVEFRMKINQMVPTKNIKMHYAVDFFQTTLWKDYRMEFNSTLMKNLTYLPFDQGLAEKIWKPNVYFVQSKYGYKTEVPQIPVMSFIQPDGTVGYNSRLKMDVHCPMDMTYFPFDTQVCNLTIETYSYTTKFVRLKWKELSYKPDMQVADFEKVTFKPYENPGRGYGELGKWDNLVVQFTFNRNAKLYVVRDLIPCAMIVMLSWLNFWITHRSTPARVALGITTVLTVVTMTNGVRTNTPSSGSIRAIDIYMFSCNLFVFLALGEAALVGMTAPNEKYANEETHTKDDNRMQTEKTDSETNGIVGTPASMSIDGNNNEEDAKKQTKYRHPKCKTNAAKQTMQKEDNISKNFNPLLTDMVKIGPIYFYKGDVHIVDKISRILFPLAFVLFNVLFLGIIKLTQ